MATNTVIWNDNLISGIDSNDQYYRLNDLGRNFTTSAGREYEPQTQNTYAFQWLFDPYQVEWIARRVGTRKLAIFGSNSSITLYSANSTANNKIAKSDLNARYNQNLSIINHVLNNSMQSLNSPTKSAQSIILDYFNAQVKFAGKPTFDNAQITFNTLVGLGTKNILEAWSSMVLDETTLRGGWGRSVNGTGITSIDPVNGLYDANSELPDLSDEKLFAKLGYKVDGILLECARDGTIINQWDYIGMWISSFNAGNFTMAGSNTPSQISATITVDLIRR